MKKVLIKGRNKTRKLSLLEKQEMESPESYADTKYVFLACLFGELASTLSWEERISEVRAKTLEEGNHF